MRRVRVVTALCLALLAVLTLSSALAAPLGGISTLSEGFDDITTLPGDGWALDNNSQPLGVTEWFQGNPDVFPAYDGAPEAYIGANYNSVGDLGTISNWLITPELNLDNGAEVSFWTTTVAGSAFPDRLELRLSTSGDSVDVGTGAEDVGDFDTLLLEINPDLDVGGYPEEWTQFTATLSGLGGPTTGRVAMRYYVTDGGLFGANSNYIGIDRVEYALDSGGGGDPAIEVDPAALAATQDVDEVTQQTLTIRNTGGDALAFTIDEAEAPRPFDSYPPMGDPALSSAGRAPQREGSAPRQSGPLGTGGTPAFGVEFVAFGQPTLVSLALEDATNLIPVGPVGGFNPAGDFASDDFTTLYSIDDDTDQLEAIDTATGNETVIGPSTPQAGQQWTGMAWDETRNTMFAASSSCGVSSQLYTIDLATGDATFVGNIAPGTCIINLAAADGTLYGVDIVSDVLATIDPATGAPSPVGSVGFDANFAQGMDYDDAGDVMYMAAFNNITFSGELRTVNLDTGATTFVSIIDGGFAEIDSFGIATTDGGGGGEPCDTPSDIPWLDVTPNNGVVSGGSEVDVTVTFDSTGLVPGTYTALLCVNSNDPANPQVIVPVALNVEEGGGGDPSIVVDPTSLEAELPVNQTTDETLTISNVGSADLIFTIDEAESTLRLPNRPPLRSEGSRVAPPAAVDGNSLSRGTGASEAFGQQPRVPAGSTTITHSTSQDIVPLNSVSCNDGFGHTDNSYYRVFDLANDFSITGDFDVTTVEFGVEEASAGAGGSQPISVILYTLDGPLALANLTEIGRTDTTIANQSLTIFSVAVNGTVPAGEVLVVEIFTPSGQTEGNLFFIGSNPEPETAPSYLRADDCGITQPTPIADVGFPDMHIVMNVTGDEGGGGACTPSDLPWVEVAPITDVVVPGGSTDVTVTFDSTGLSTGTYTGNLCVNSNDPQNPQVIVPLTLTVSPPTAVTLSDMGSRASTLPLGILVATGFVALAAGGLLLRRRRA